MEKLFLEIVSLGLVERFKSGDYPNIPFPTMGGHVMWINIEESMGWKLQRNSITGHYRILNPKDIRMAWGTREVMTKLMKDILK